MLKKEVIELLEQEHIPYKAQEVNGVEFVYAYGKKTYKGYTPYVRMSHFGYYDTYVRMDGIIYEECEDEDLIEMLKGLKD